MATLPNELWLEIFCYLDRSDLWTVIHNVNRQFRACAEDIATKELLQDFTISLTYTLGSGSHHRWYDISGTITLGFKHINRVNPQYALFEVTGTHPESCYSRTVEKWKRMCASGFGPEQAWPLKLGGNPRLVKMPNLVLAADDGLWCDWREMLNGYFNNSRR